MLEPVETSEGYIRLPRVLFTDSQYKTLSNDAKVLYGLLLDRLQLSIKNGWRDPEGRVFIHYKVKEIQKALNCGHDKTINLLKTLESENIALIKRVHQGNGQTDRIYVREFKLTGKNTPVPPSTPPQKPSSSDQYTGSENQTSESKTFVSGASAERISEPSVPALSEMQTTASSSPQTFQQEVPEIENAEPVRSGSQNHPNNLLLFPPSFQQEHSDVCNYDAEITAKTEKLDDEGLENRPAGTDFRPAGLETRPYSYKDFSYPEFSTLLPLSPSTQNRPSQMGGVAGIRTSVCENIDYGVLRERFPDDTHYLSRIVSLVTEMLRSQKPTLRVNQEEVPAEDVKERLWQLRYEHVEYALLVIAETKNIGSIRGFLPTVLYNATEPGTLETYYDSRVKHDLEQEWDVAKPAYAI